MTKRFFTLAALLLSIGIGPARAQENYAARAIAIFADTCGQFVGQTNELRAHLAAQYKRFPAARERELLLGNGGQAWRSPDQHQFGIFSLDDGECDVVTDQVPPEAIRAALRDLMAKLEKYAKVTVKLRGDTAQRESNGEVRTLIYAAGNPGARGGVQYLLETLQNSRQQIFRLAATSTDMTQ